MLNALRKIAKDQKIDILAKVISENWGSDGDDDNSESIGLVYFPQIWGKHGWVRVLLVAPSYC